MRRLIWVTAVAAILMSLMAWGRLSMDSVPFLNRDARADEGGGTFQSALLAQSGGAAFPASLVRDSWERYKARFIQQDGRVIDHKGNKVSTSEGQSYALLRAVWMDDRQTFDRVLQWTYDNLNAGQRSDHLLCWKWGRRDDGSWGIYQRESASDADQFVALSLILGARRWKEETYLNRARELLNDIWRLEVVVVNGLPYIKAGDWQSDTGLARLNPSYFLPFAYRIFAGVDRKHDWKGLVTASYRIVSECRSRVGLPTDWCFLSIPDGKIHISPDVFDSTCDTGFEAFRVYWNLAADYAWYKESRAMEALKAGEWIRHYFAIRREIPSVLTLHGIPRSTHEYVGLYGSFLPALMLMDPAHGALLYQQKISPTYRDGYWGDADDYYQQNWVWFGLALISDAARMIP